jgi:hypothetical protein
VCWALFGSTYCVFWLSVRVVVVEVEMFMSRQR